MPIIVGVIAGLIFVAVTAGQWYILPLLGDAGVPLCIGSIIFSIILSGFFGSRYLKKTATEQKKAEEGDRR